MRTKVICEISSNYQSLFDIQESIGFCEQVGAVPKLQAFTHAEMKTPNPELDRDWMVELKDTNVFYSVFGLDSLTFLEKRVNPKLYKIASGKAKDKELIQAVAEIGKPTIISTGGCSLEDIRNICKWFREAHQDTTWWADLTLMQCNPVYPAPTDLLGNLRNRIIGSQLIQWGLSSHSTDIVSPVMAVALGATCIEKHFAIRWRMTPDIGHSLLPYAFIQMVRDIELAELHMETRE